MAKFYAVKKGRKTGILNTWSECQKSVIGFSGAEYKSFATVEECNNYLNPRISPKIEDTDRAIAYVDGSYNEDTKTYGSGAILLYKGQEICFSIAGDRPEMAVMRNVAGEIMAALTVMKYCDDKGILALDIYYDYTGIEKWCTGEWSAKKSGTQEYKEYYDLAIVNNIDVSFFKVKAHSGIKYNEMADALAKKAAGI